MTAASAPIPQGRHPRFDYIATRLAHWTPALFGVIVALTFAAGFTKPHLGTWGGMAVFGIPACAVLLLAITVNSWHVYALCPVCARKTPLDPEAKVAQKRRRLSALHWFGEQHPRLTKTIQWTLIVLAILPWTIGGIAYLLLMAWMAGATYLINVHMPLQPWCPQCRGGWGEGGDKEIAPDPDPAGAPEKVS